MAEVEFAKFRPGGSRDVARSVANDPGAPRRALTSERAVVPGQLAGTFGGRSTEAVHDEDWNDRVTAHLVATAGFGEIDEITPEQRVLAYEAMHDEMRSEWDRHWRHDALSWIDAVPDLFGPEVVSQRHGPTGWPGARVYDTVDGGRLLVCPYEDDRFEGLPAWCEAIRFGLHEVAAAAGVNVPTRWDVD